MLDAEMLEYTIAGFALGIIILARLAQGFGLPILLIGVFLLVVGLVINAGVVPTIDTNLNVSVENEEAALVLVGMVGFFAALAGAYYFWKKRKKSKEEVSGDMLEE
jgi:LPXTG-motif cell wall-anchored protein